MNCVFLVKSTNFKSHTHRCMLSANWMKRCSHSTTSFQISLTWLCLTHGSLSSQRISWAILIHVSSVQFGRGTTSTLLAAQAIWMFYTFWIINNRNIKNDFKKHFILCIAYLALSLFVFWMHLYHFKKILYFKTRFD